MKGGGEFGDVDVDAEVDRVLDRLVDVSSGSGCLHEMGFEAGRRLIVSSRDPTKLGAFIEGKTAQCELRMAGEMEGSLESSISTMKSRLRSCLRKGGLIIARFRR
jgi:hypothetical protein